MAKLCCSVICVLKTLGGDWEKTSAKEQEHV